LNGQLFVPSVCVELTGEAEAIDLNQQELNGGSNLAAVAKVTTQHLTLLSGEHDVNVRSAFGQRA